MLVLSTQGGIREPDGSPLALGYHTGHWEVGLLMRAAAEELRRHHCMPFAGFCTDPCDGRTQGTTGMMDSLPFRNDAAVVLRRLIRSLPTRAGVLGIAAAATPQLVAEALGLSLGHSALAPSGQPIWLDMARRSARALIGLSRRGLTTRDVITEASIRNAMAVHAAFGGSTNLLLHVPAIAHAAGVWRPAVEDWIAVNRRVPRLVDALPNGPHPTIRVFMAGGVPEVMLHLRRIGLLDGSAMTVSGEPLDAAL